MLGEKLLKLRKKFGYSQQELADKLSVTRQTISNWECGQGAPTIDKAMELAAIFGISLDDLVGDQVNVIVSEKNRGASWILKQLEGKTVKISCVDMKSWLEAEFSTIDGSDTVRVVEVTADWLRVEYERTKEGSLLKKETVATLIDINAVNGVEIVEVD